MKTLNPTMTPDEVGKLPALCSVKQASDLTGYATHFLSDCLARGEIKGVKFGGRWRVDTAALLRKFGLAE